MPQKKRTVTRPSSPTKTPGQANWLHRDYLHYVILFAGAFLLYGWTSTFDYSLDDDYILSYFSTVERSWSGLIGIFHSWFGSSDYRPVTLLAFWAERQFFGELTASRSHFINVSLFGLVLIALYRFIRAAAFYSDPDKIKLLALFSCLIFLVHPNHVSVVANIKSRDNLLSMLFGLMAARQLLLAYDLRQLLRILLFIVLILAALLAKRDSYSFMVVPLLILVIFRSVDLKRAVRLVLGIAVLAIIISKLYGIFHSLPDETHLQFQMRGSENPLANGGTLTEHVSLAISSLFYYLKFLIVPFGYYFYFGYNQVPLLPLLSPVHILTITVAALLFALSLWAFRRDRIYLFCLIAFMLSIAYALNLYTPVAGIIMDRYNFIPSIYFCLALSALLLNGIGPHPQKNPTFVLLALLISFGVCSVYRTSAWKDHYTLFDRDMEHLDRSANANRLAGGTYIHMALMEEMRPNYNRQLTDSFIQKGERYILRSLDIYDKSPQAWELAGLCDLYRRKDSSALHKFQRCLDIDSTYFSGINYIGFTYWNLNQLDSAIHYFSYVMDREPYFNYSANNLVNLYLKNYRNTEADSVLNALYHRFPADRQLLKKLEEVYGVPYPRNNP